MQTLIVKTEKEMVAQLNLLLCSGYDVGIHKDNSVFGDNVSYLIAYQKTKERSNTNENP